MKTGIPNYYDPENARELARYAAGAYGEDGMIDSGQCVEDRGTDTRAVVWRESDGDVVVAFRGTRSLRNFVTDVCARRVAFWNGCPMAVEVHGGFLRALNSVYAGVYGVVERALGETVKELGLAVSTSERGTARGAGVSPHRGDGGSPGGSPYQARRLWVTGHSLGGALAKLFAARCKLPLAGIYTFGEPRVGNAGFRDYYDALLKSRTFRVVDGDDFVTRIPWLLGAYRHCGTEIFYDCNGQALVDPPWWRKGVSDVFGSWEEWRQEGRLALVNDHHVSRYVTIVGGPGGTREMPECGCRPTAATKEEA